MRAFLSILWPLVFGLLCSACPQQPDLRPRLQRLVPDLLAQGQERYVTLHGYFPPQASWKSAQDPALDLTFTVRLGGETSDHVVVTGPDALVARVPPSLELGCHDVEVVGPGGDAVLRSDGLCLTQTETSQIAFGCLNPGGGFDLCALPADLQSVETSVLVAGLVPDLNVSRGVYQLDDSLPAYSFSPDGRLLAFMRDLPALGSNPARRALLLAHLDGSGGEQEISSLPLEEESQSELEVFSVPVFSPDGEQLVWVERGRRLMRVSLAELSSGSAQAVQLHRIPDDDNTSLHYPDVDPTGRWVLLTWLSGQQSDNSLKMSLMLVSLAGGGVRRLRTHSEAEPALDGPGVFLPSGEGVLFTSDRLGLEIPSPSLVMQRATNLYVFDLVSEKVRPLGDPVGSLLLGRPAVSPNGRLALVGGVLNDLTGSGLDILAVDLDTGQMSRTFRDPVPFCYPDLYRECDLGEYHGCCGYVADAYQCCSALQPLACPSFDSYASFGFDSLGFVANMVPVHWECVSWQGRNVWSYDNVRRDSGLPWVYLIVGLPDPDSVLGVTPWLVDGASLLALAPRFRQTLSEQ